MSAPFVPLAGLADTDAPPPRVSVVMPVYNAAATIDATIASVMAQTERDFELIAVNDGSTDDSLARLLDWAAADPRLRVISRDNAGVSAARNLGVDLARAPLIAFIDADDLWHETKLAQHCALHAGRGDAAASYARIAFIAADARGLDGAQTCSSLCPHDPQLIDVLGENPVCTMSNLVVARSAFVAAGGFDAALTHAEDQDLVARLIDRGGALVGIDAVLTGYRFSRQGLSMDLDRMFAGWRTVAARFLPAGAARAQEALYYRYLARRTLRSGGSGRLALRYVVAGLRTDARAFCAEYRRGLATIAAALVAPLLPVRVRIRLFA